jgi:hypothetical protein
VKLENRVWSHSLPVCFVVKYISDRHVEKYSQAAAIRFFIALNIQGVSEVVNNYFRKYKKFRRFLNKKTTHADFIVLEFLYEIFNSVRRTWGME